MENSNACQADSKTVIDTAVRDVVSPESPATKAVDFLRRFDPDGWHNVVSIDPETHTVSGVTAHAWDMRPIAAFIDAHVGKQNLYFSVNEPRDGAENKKLRKEDFQSIRAIFADCDPLHDVPLAEERARLAAQTESLLTDSEFCPSFVIDSGGGHQPVWMLEQPLTLTDGAAEQHRLDAEMQGRGIAQKFGAGSDAVQNIDRVLRLPGTLNIPDAKKKARGRIEAPASVIAWPGKKHRFADLARFAAPLAAPDRGTKDGKPATAKSVGLDWSVVTAATSFDELPEDLQIKFNAAMEADSGLALRWLGSSEGLKDPSRSGLDMSLAAHLKMARFSPTEVGQILYVFDHGRGADCDPRYVARCFANNAAAPRTTAEEDFLSPEEREARAAAQSWGAVEDMLALPNEKPRKARLPRKWVRGLSLPGEPLALVAKTLEQQALAVLYGPSNAGKTFLALDLAAHVAAGIEWGGRKVTRGAVVYIAAEAGRGAEKRMVAWCQAHGICDIPMILVPAPVNLRDSKADLAEVRDVIREAAEQSGLPCRLVVIDTLARAFGGGEENSSKDMGSFVDNMTKIVADTGVTILVVHHSGKNETAGARGHSSLKAALATELEAVKGKGDSVGTLTISKQQEMQYAPDIRYRLRTVELTPDDEGN